MKDRKIAVLLLPSNQIPIVERLLPQIDEKLDEIQTGDFIEIFIEIDANPEKFLNALSKVRKSNPMKMIELNRTMISVKGKFKKGAALPLEPVEEHYEGQSVIITFLEKEAREVSATG